MVISNVPQTEKAILIGLARKSTQKTEIADSLDELAELAFSAGARVEDKLVQTRNPDSAYYIGKGMVNRL